MISGFQALYQTRTPLAELEQNGVFIFQWQSRSRDRKIIADNVQGKSLTLNHSAPSIPEPPNLYPPHPTVATRVMAAEKLKSALPCRFRGTKSDAVWKRCILQQNINSSVEKKRRTSQPGSGASSSSSSNNHNNNNNNNDDNNDNNGDDDNNNNNNKNLILLLFLPVSLVESEADMTHHVESLYMTICVVKCMVLLQCMHERR
ncbi:hypothetical protein PoB_000387500 [Plakobranchus ocellatus]|uniref:Uncharacterized protein n=1 Tax=Plakobranchus ocellatus TaxID=259542 RepID=A0AAV3Y3G0_9GAST|nr:hypothetical protein PoB_000387500 [Plakobranchus ocellatus]